MLIRQKVHKFYLLDIEWRLAHPFLEKYYHVVVFIGSPGSLTGRGLKTPTMSTNATQPRLVEEKATSRLGRLGAIQQHGSRLSPELEHHSSIEGAQILVQADKPSSSEDTTQANSVDEKANPGSRSPLALRQSHLSSELERRGSIDDARSLVSADRPPSEEENLPPSKVYHPFSPHVVALLMPASIFGALARVGLLALTTYDGREIFPLAWVQAAGCLVMGFAIGMKEPIGELCVSYDILLWALN